MWEGARVLATEGSSEIDAQRVGRLKTQLPQSGSVGGFHA